MITRLHNWWWWWDNHLCCERATIKQTNKNILTKNHTENPTVKHVNFVKLHFLKINTCKYKFWLKAHNISQGNNRRIFRMRKMKYLTFNPTVKNGYMILGFQGLLLKHSPVRCNDLDQELPHSQKTQFLSSITCNQYPKFDPKFSCLQIYQVLHSLSEGNKSGD